MYDERDIPVKVVINIRAEWVASLEEISTELQTILPGMQLLQLGKEPARQAILAPAASVGVDFELGLVDELLKQLAGIEGTTVFPPHLQLACHVLYDARDPDHQLITRAAYDALGGLEGILNFHLEEQLRTLFVTPDRNWAHHVLEDLISLSQTTESKPIEEIALSLHTSVSHVAPIVEKLVSARLLRDVEVEDGSTAYELAHEYLISRITLTGAALARKEAEQLIKPDVDAWKRYGLLMSSERYELVNARREHLPLTPDRSELMLRCAIRHNKDIDYWMKALITEDATRIVREILSDPEPQVRLEDRVHAITAAAHLPQDHRRTLLYEHALSPEIAVATEARALLNQHMREDAVRDFSVLWAGGDREVREQVIRVLADLDTPAATMEIVRFLGEQTDEARLNTIKVVAQGRSTAVQRLLAEVAACDAFWEVRAEAREAVVASTSSDVARALFELSVPRAADYRDGLREAVRVARDQRIVNSTRNMLSVGVAALKVLPGALNNRHNRALWIACQLKSATSVDALVDILETELRHRPHPLVSIAGWLFLLPLVLLPVSGLRLLPLVVIGMLAFSRWRGPRKHIVMVSRIHWWARYFSGQDGGHEYLLAQSIPLLLALVTWIGPPVFAAGIGLFVYVAYFTMLFSFWVLSYTDFSWLISGRGLSYGDFSWFISGPGISPIRYLTARAMIRHCDPETLCAAIQRAVMSPEREFPVQLARHLLTVIEATTNYARLRSELEDSFKELFAGTIDREIDPEIWLAIGSMLRDRHAIFVNEVAQQEVERPASRYRRQAAKILGTNPRIRPWKAILRYLSRQPLRFVTIVLFLLSLLLLVYAYLRNPTTRTEQPAASWQVDIYKENHSVLWISGDKQLRRLELDGTGDVLSTESVVINTNLMAFGCNSNGVFCVFATPDRIGVLKDGNLHWGILPDRWSNQNRVWASDETVPRLWLQAGPTFYVSTDVGASWSQTLTDREIPDPSGDQAEAPSRQTQSLFVRVASPSGQESDLLGQEQGLPNGKLERAVLPEPGRPAVLLAAGPQTSQIWYSSLGLSWQKAQVPLDDAEPQTCGAQYSSLMVNTRGTIPLLYRRYTLLNGEKGILISRDRGQRWTKISVSAANPLRSQLLARLQPCVIIERLKQLN